MTDIPKGLKRMEKKYESDLTPAEKRKERLKTIKRLKGKARLEYIWEYYRFLLVFVIAAVLVISTAVTMIRNSQQNIVLSIAVVDADKQIDQTNEELAEQIHTALKLPENEQVKVHTAVSSVESQENEAKLTMVMSPVSENDIVICGQDVYDKFKDTGVFQEISSVLKGNIEKYQNILTNGQLDLAKCPNQELAECVTDTPAYVLVLNHSQNEAIVKMFIHYITKI